ncbi:MAG TPA: NUDIX domain-containing protein [Candidatus Nanoarchaeia archaeon]|nr:NUDIX domain-containing protein [Candidatus Nanoarchaeia archaeon]
MKNKLSWDLTKNSSDLFIGSYRKRILHNLTYNQSVTFNQLWGKEGESNKFAYHLKKLEKEGLIRKINHYYCLTDEGKKTVAYHTNNKMALIVVAIVITEKNKYLMLDRSKEPFYGHVCLHAGKLDFSKYPLEAAEELTKNDTGLTCKFKLKGLFSSKTFENNTQAYNHQILIVKATHPKGDLIKKIKKGTNKWMTLKEIKAAKILPNIPHLIDIAESNRFKWVEMDRFIEKDHFKKISIKRSQII